MAVGALRDVGEDGAEPQAAAEPLADARAVAGELAGAVDEDEPLEGDGGGQDVHEASLAVGREGGPASLLAAQGEAVLALGHGERLAVGPAVADLDEAVGRSGQDGLLDRLEVALAVLLHAEDLAELPDGLGQEGERGLRSLSVTGADVGWSALSASTTGLSSKSRRSAKSAAARA